MSAYEIKAATELTEAVNGLKFGAMVFIAVIAGILLVGFWLWLMSKRQEQHAKNERSKRFSMTLDDLRGAVLHQTVVLDRHTNNEQFSFATLNDSVDSLGVSMQGLHGAMQDLIARQSGAINRTDSLRIVETYFHDVILREIQALLEISLKKNEYQQRKEFIERRIKTEVGNILQRAAKALSDYKLSVNCAFFFEVVPDITRMRYTLVDQIWEKIQPIYLTGQEVGAKIEEMRVTVENIVQDYVARIKNEFDEVLYNGGDRG
jgi:hypothetical protein